MKQGQAVAARQRGRRDVDANIGGRRPRFGSKGEVPAMFRRGFSVDERKQITNDIEIEMASTSAELGRSLTPSEYQLCLQNVLQRMRNGIAYEDAVRLQHRGKHGYVVPTGPLAGTKILDAQMQLSASPVQPSDVLFKTERGEMMLSSGQGSKGGGGAGEQAPVRSAADKWLHGLAAGVVPMAFMDQVVSRAARVPTFLALCKQGIMPDLTFEFPLQINTVIDELFEGTNLRDFKTGIGVPREEGTSTGNYVSARFASSNIGCRGYTWYSRETQELLDSRGGQILGVQQRDADILMRAPGHVMDRDIFLALWYGLEIGYTRRYDATANAWDVATQEVPWGKSAFIDGQAQNHVGWWDYFNGKLYTASPDANYRKYGSAVDVPAGIFPGNPAGANKLIQAITFMHKIMADKFETLNAVCLPQDFLYAMAQDEFWQNALYNRANQKVNLSGEAGYVSTIILPGTAEEVSIFKYQKGHLPAPATGLLRTTDAAPLDIDEVMIGATLGEVITAMPFWPFTMMRYPEMTFSSVDGQNVAAPTMREVLMGYHMEAVEPWNLRKCCLLKCMNKAKP